jgi:TonB family protein
VDEVQVERSAGHPALDHAALDAVRRSGAPVAVWVLIPVEFTLH